VEILGIVVVIVTVALAAVLIALLLKVQITGGIRHVDRGRGRRAGAAEIGEEGRWLILGTTRRAGRQTAGASGSETGLAPGGVVPAPSP